MNRDKIVQFLRMRGPSLPVHVASYIKTSVMLAGSMLSELKSQGMVKISYLKVGGSPLYYLPDQEKHLSRFLDKLNDKDKAIAERLQKEGVLRDTSLDALARVALRNLKDFAKPLNVAQNGSEEIFWKWYELDAKATRERIGELLGQKSQQQKLPHVEQKKAVVKVEEKKDVLEEQKEIIKEKKTIVEEKKEEIKNAKPTKEIEGADTFLENLLSLFLEKGILVHEQEKVRKEKEYNFIIEIKSSIGPLIYFCKAKSKQKINDGDLSATLLQSQSKKLPVLFLTTGTFTKKAQSMLKKELKGIAVYHIGS